MFTLFFILILVFLFALGIGAFFMKIITNSINRKGDLGLNFQPVICPQCHEETKLIRPATMKNIPWGGGACKFCGCEMDKWGNEISQLGEKEKVLKQLEHIKITPISSFDKFGKTRLEKIFEENDK